MNKSTYNCLITYSFISLLVLLAWGMFSIKIVSSSTMNAVYSILSKIMAFPLLLLVIGVLLGTSYCGINIRSMLDHVDLRLFYLNGKIIIYVCISIYILVSGNTPFGGSLGPQMGFQFIFSSIICQLYMYLYTYIVELGVF